MVRFRHLTSFIVHIVETQQRHAAQQPTTPAPSEVELRRELADANANCAAADRVAKRAKDIADKAEALMCAAGEKVAYGGHRSRFSRACPLRERLATDR